MRCQTSDVHHDDLHHKFEEPRDVTSVQGEPWPPVAVEPNKDGFHVVLPSVPGGCVSVPITSEGRKNDTNKLRYDLIPPGPLALLAEVYTIGAKKYDDRNWEKGIKWGRIFAALMRHAWAWWRGEKNDSVDGQHHLASVAWCAFALMEYEKTHTEFDDRGNQ